MESREKEGGSMDECKMAKKIDDQGGRFDGCRCGALIIPGFLLLNRKNDVAGVPLTHGPL